MLKCPNCGKLNNSRSKFCRFCGTKLDTAKLVNEPTNNEIKCPNCGTINKTANKFCVKCGYRLNERAFNQQNNYSHQWSKANQTMNTAYAYFNNYFKWLKNSLIHPLKSHATNPYFGITSFSIITVFLWIAEVIGRNSPAMMNNIDYLITSDSPLKVYIKNYENTETPIGMLILSIVSVGLYVLAGYIGSNFISSSKGILSIVNDFAKLINVDIIIALVLIIVSLINQITLAWVVSDIFQMIFYVGLITLILVNKNKSNSVLSRIYIISVILVSYDILQSLITAVLGVMMA